MKHLLERLGVETSHFVGQGWRKGTSSPVVAAQPLEKVLVAGRRVQSNHLKERLIREGLKRRRCELCEREDWNGRPIPLELDHVNGRGISALEPSSRRIPLARVAESGETRRA